MLELLKMSALFSRRRRRRRKRRKRRTTKTSCRKSKMQFSMSNIAGVQNGGTLILNYHTLFVHPPLRD